MRPGARALSLLAAPLNLHLLQAIECDHGSLTDLRRAVGSPPDTTMRAYLRTLAEIGAIERRRLDDFPGSASYVLTEAGRELLAVGEVLQRWLEAAPEAPIALGSRAAKSATKALVDGWSSHIVRALAAKPLALTELSRLIPTISYPALERRLTAMRLAGQIEARREENSRGTPYRATNWLRRGVAPIVAAGCWERRFAAAEAPPMGKLDVEAMFLLAAPLVELPEDASGTCRLTVELTRGSSPEFGGVLITVERGRLVSCVSRIEGTRAQAWVNGTVVDWFCWVDQQEGRQLETGGDVPLADAVAESFRGALNPRARAPLH